MSNSIFKAEIHIRLFKKNPFHSILQISETSYSLSPEWSIFYSGSRDGLW